MDTARATMPTPIDPTTARTTGGLSIVREWIAGLPLRHQGVLLAAIRGCDGLPKENPAKPIVRALRYVILNPADEREVSMRGAFMQRGFHLDALRGFLGDWDHYPVHFVQHLMHACQVVGFKHPDPDTRALFAAVYLGMIAKLHVMPEGEAAMDARLTEDRIARDAGEADFHFLTSGEMPEARELALLALRAERQRQVFQEGYNPHDDAVLNPHGELARAAACYALAASDPRAPHTLPSGMWPWREETWKPRDAEANLIRAGALIIAELERRRNATDPEAIAARERYFAASTENWPRKSGR